MLRTAFGPMIAAALDDPGVIEVMVNPDGRLWLDRQREGRAFTGEWIGMAEAERVIRLVASHIRAEVNRDAPIVSAELPGRGERFEGVLPPVSPAPCFAIRKSVGGALMLDEYVAQGVMTFAQAAFLRQALKDRANVLVAGGTSSGKTTLANALLREISFYGERVVILEDTRELHCEAEDSWRFAPVSAR
jgi:type IV secretion system protein VirB11